MAVLTIGAAMNLGGMKTLHPFFSKTQNTEPQVRNETKTKHDVAQHANDDHRQGSDPDYEDTTGGPAKTRKPQQQKSLGSHIATAKSKALLENFTKKGGVEFSADTSHPAVVGRPNGSISTASGVDGELTKCKRKRRKISSKHDPVLEISASKKNDFLSLELATLEEPANDVLENPKQTLEWIDQLQTAAGESVARTEVEASSPSGVVDDLPQGGDIISATPPVEIQSSPPSTRQRRKRSSRKTSPTDWDTESVQVADVSMPPKATPKKMLRLNASGKFSSPVFKSTDEEQPHSGNENAKVKKSNSIKRTGSCTVVIRYGDIDKTGTRRTSHVEEDKGHTTRLGAQIDSIMKGELTAPNYTARQQSPVKAIVAAKPKGPPKATHPFFTGKRIAKEEAQATTTAATIESLPKLPSPRKSAVTPGKLRSDVKLHDTDVGFSGFSSASFRANIVKHPGASEAPWPWKGVAHTRNPVEMLPPDGLAFRETNYTARRSKGIATFVPDDEDILHTFGQRLRDLPVEDQYADHQFPPPSKSIRLPQRLVTNGSVILDMARSQLEDVLGPSSLDDSSAPVTQSHPAISGLLIRFEESLTSFDKGTCETQAWAQKYAPKQASDVLQSTQSMAVLRTWLTSLKVQTVGGNPKELSAKMNRKERSQKPAKKRRKKSSELDGFIVDSDDASEMDELTEPEEISDGDGRKRNGPRSMVRVGDSNSKGSIRKLKNLILISGPHGCGKTAAVYAIAKEMAFDVFEINSGSRRSGKDITERVGDMSENHLVSNRQDNHVGASLVDSDTERAAEAFQKDIASGRQGMMTSFFHKKTGLKKAKPKVKRQEDHVKVTNIIKEVETKIRQRKSQQQSLILLEEVDVLFEEDKGFWSTVIDLAVQSKRPMILTCNNESLLPMGELSFEAVLRFTPPPERIVSAYLTMMAAREGHILERSALVSLYRSKSEDLRATIAELNFWCQMAVGDRRGGLEWIYQRWPPGKDVDGEGKTLRVASKGTYLSGMGWVSRDAIHDCLSAGIETEEEVTRQLWNDWSIDPADTICVSRSIQDDLAARQIDSLNDWEFFADGLSAADVFCRIGLPATRPCIADTTQPLISEKARHNYISGLPLIQTDELHDYQNIDTQLASSFAIRLRSPRENLLSSPANSSPLETSCISTILEHKRALSDLSEISHDVVLNVFEPITYPRPDQLYTGTPANSCISDRPLHIVTTDVAPYVRSIAASDLKLESDRLRLSNLLSEGGRAAKRARTTRASRSALEGGKRETTRRERWFYKDLNLKAVLKTAGKGWAGMGAIIEKDDGSDMASTVSGSQVESHAASSPEG